MCGIVSYLNFTTAVGFIHRYLHRIGYLIGIHNYPATVITGRTANGLDQ
jgi:hypothetical protein